MRKEQLNRIAQPIVDVYDKIEMEILTSIGESLRNNKSLLDDNPALWGVQTLEHLGLLNQRTLRLLKDHSGLLSREINKALHEVSLSSLKHIDNELERITKERAHLVKPQPLNKSPTMLNIMQSFNRTATSALNITNMSLLDNTRQSYIDIVNEAVMRVSTGLSTGEEALRRIAKEWSIKGVPALVDRAGRKRGLEGYVRTVLVTTNNHLARDIQEQRTQDWGVELVEISQHAGDRPGCAPYAGRVFSLKPNHPKYPYLYDPAVGRIGAPDSLFGINCGHFMYPFIEGVSIQRYEKPTAEDKVIYEQSQKQRAIERSIRQAKTEKRMLEAMGDEAGAVRANKLISKRQAVMRKFIDETGRTRRYYREGIYGRSDDIPKAKPTPPPKPPPLPTKKPYSSYKFATDERASKLANQGNEIYRSFTKEEKTTYKSYVGTGNSFDMNYMLYSGEYADFKSGLREIRRDSERQNLANIDSFSELIKKNSIPQDLKLARNVDTSFLDSVFKDVGIIGEGGFESIWKINLFDDSVAESLNKALEGVQWTNKSFMSTSYDPDLNLFAGRDVSMEILVDKGTRGLITDNDRESEIVLDKDTKLEFVSFKVEGKKINIVARVIK